MPKYYSVGQIIKLEMLLSPITGEPIKRRETILKLLHTHDLDKLEYDDVRKWWVYKITKEQIDMMNKQAKKLLGDK